MTHTQANLIIGLLTVIAFGVGQFVVTDWYWLWRAAAQRQRDAREAHFRRMAQETAACIERHQAAGGDF